jgi:hypothetical protein
VAKALYKKYNVEPPAKMNEAVDIGMFFLILTQTFLAISKGISRWKLRPNLITALEKHNLE